MKVKLPISIQTIFQNWTKVLLTPSPSEESPPAGGAISEVFFSPPGKCVNISPAPPAARLSARQGEAGRSPASDGGPPQRWQKFNLGFTLIELMVVVSVIGLFTGGVIASFVKFNQRETLKKAALTVKSYFRDAQTRALAGEKSEDCGDEQTLDGWCVDLVRRKMYGHCGGTVAESLNFNLKDIDLPEGVNLSFFPSEGSILRFKPGAQGVDKFSTICFSLSSYIYKLEVTTAGEINDHGFVDSCP